MGPANPVQAMRIYDTQPSILSHPITSSITRSASGEADSKRTKLTPPTGPVTISSLVQDGAYDTLQALVKDVESATTEILASSGASDSSAVPASPEHTALQAKVLAFETMLKSLVGREEARRAHVQGSEVDADAQAEPSNEDGTPVHIKEEEQEADVPQSRTVLTLYGSAPPKQLFSSLQQPQKVAPADGVSTLDTSVKITLPLRETNLPNLISTTEVYPLPEPDSKKKVATIGEVFRAPSHLPQISPPKSARPTTSKGNSTITFAHQEPPKPRRKGSQSYAHQTLSAGFWLGYGGVDMPKDQTSPTAKQKSRQRALSMGEAQQPPSEAILVAVQQAREDALFRSAYSSFAPTRDDTSAIIPEETKNMVWWQKVGEKRFNEMFPIDPALLDAEEAQRVIANCTADEEEQFKEAVDNFTPLDPSTPSSEEFDVYEILKSQLTLLISQLPPYAVAKLNGDQMEELNISRTILFDTKEYKGVLEEDQLSKLAKAPAMPTSTPAALARTSSGTSVHYPAGHQYSRPAPAVPQSGARPVYSQQPSLHRSSSIHVQRSPSVTSQTFQPGGIAYAPSSRPGYPATPSYNQQTPRPNYGTTPSGQYFPQRSAQPNSYGGAAGSQYYNPTPQAQGQNRYATQQNQSSFYPRSQNVAPLYNGGQTPQQRTASPMKAAPTPAAYAARPAYGTPISGGQMRSTYYGPPQYATPQAPATTAPYNGMSNNPQQMMIDRQQAQVAAQSQARLAAQNSFSSSRQGSGTPQPPNGSMFGANGASMST
ncbi:repeatmulti-domain protein [Pyrenophora tritici-repentis]|nr:repeatmulti-domain protein [Pyrenophora tritici-repentis]KAI1605936.1 repeatmulti-domain protein [Pyrenophora tritici-repentis]